LQRSAEVAVVGGKAVFAAEELRTSLTSGQYRRLEQSATAIVVKNTAFEWPFRPDGAAREKPTRSKTPWHHKLAQRGGEKGEIYV